MQGESGATLSTLATSFGLHCESNLFECATENSMRSYDNQDVVLGMEDHINDMNMLFNSHRNYRVG